MSVTMPEYMLDKMPGNMSAVMRGYMSEEFARETAV